MLEDSSAEESKSVEERRNGRRNRECLLRELVEKLPEEETIRWKRIKETTYEMEKMVDKISNIQKSLQEEFKLLTGRKKLEELGLRE